MGSTIKSREIRSGDTDGEAEVLTYIGSDELKTEEYGRNTKGDREVETSLGVGAPGEVS